MPCAEGGNQASVQAAVVRSTATFLTKEMMKVQVSQLPPLLYPLFQSRLPTRGYDIPPMCGDESPDPSSGSRSGT